MIFLNNNIKIIANNKKARHDYFILEEYELVSGHWRMRACEILEIPTLKCEVMNLSKEEATIFMVESNFQRSTIRREIGRASCRERV